MTIEVVSASAKRSPIGSYRGQFRSQSSPDLAATVIRQIINDYPSTAEKIDECFLGCVLSAGVGQAPARQALLLANLPNSIPCTTINKVCASGMKSITMAVDSIKLGQSELILAGGMESMSNAPYLIQGRSARQGILVHQDGYH